MTIHFVTGNTGKWEIARDIFAKYGLELVQTKIETPEIQSLDVKEVATYSAQYAAQKLNVPVIKSDERATILSVNSMISRIFSALSMIALKPLFDTIGVGPTFIVSSLLLIPVLICAHHLYKMKLKTIKDT